MNSGYSGPKKIEKYNLLYMVEHCEIPIHHVNELPETELLLIVDSQYGQGNVEKFNAPEIAVIDHHICVQNHKIPNNTKYGLIAFQG